MVSLLAIAATSRLGLEAIAAVDGPVAARFERKPRNLAATRADGFKHLARWAIIPTLLALTSAPTVGAPFWLSGKAPRCVKFLFASCEYEVCATFDAGDGLVGVQT